MAYATNSNATSKSLSGRDSAHEVVLISGPSASNIMQRSSKLKDNKKHLGGNSRSKSQISLISENTLMRGCHHFHYENVDLVPLQISIDRLRCVPHSKSKADPFNTPNEAAINEGDTFVRFFTLKINSERSSHSWTAHRTLKQTKEFDRMLHTCIFQRELSALPSLETLEWNDNTSETELSTMLASYFNQLTTLPTNRFNCSTVLNYLELDNHGNQLIPVVKLDLEDYFNTPAKAAGHVIKEHIAKSPDELNLLVGHLVSVLEMPRESTWWLGKSEMRLGYFPRSSISLIQKNEEEASAVDSKEAPVLKKRSGKFLTHLNRRLLWRKADSAHLALRRSGILQYRLFGSDLGELLNKTKLAFPLILTECCAFIENNLFVGVYRVGGEPMMVDRLRTIFDQDRAPDWTELVEKRLVDVHAVCSLLKAYFRELPIPLLTYQLYFDFLKLSSRKDESAFDAYLALIRQLPPPNYRILRYLVLHLYRISLQVAVKQTAKNLAIIWSQNMLKSPNTNLTIDAMTDCLKESQVIEFLISNAPALFDNDIALYNNSLSSADRVPIKMASADYPALLDSTLSRAVPSYSASDDGECSEGATGSHQSAAGAETNSRHLPRLISLSEAQRRFGSASTLDLESTDDSDAAAISPSSIISMPFTSSVTDSTNPSNSGDDQRSALKVLKNLMTRSNSKKYDLQNRRPKSVGPVTILNANFLTDRDLLDKFQPAPASNLEDMTQPKHQISKQSIPNSQPMSAPISYARKRDQSSSTNQSKVSTRRTCRFFPLPANQSALFNPPCASAQHRPILSQNSINNNPTVESNRQSNRQCKSLSEIESKTVSMSSPLGVHSIEIDCGDDWPLSKDVSYSRAMMNKTTRALLNQQNILRTLSLKEQHSTEHQEETARFTALKRVMSVNDEHQS